VGEKSRGKKGGGEGLPLGEQEDLTIDFFFWNASRRIALDKRQGPGGEKGGQSGVKSNPSRN